MRFHKENKKTCLAQPVFVYHLDSPVNKEIKELLSSIGPIHYPMGEAIPYLQIDIPHQAIIQTCMGTNEIRLTLKNLNGQAIAELLEKKLLDYAPSSKNIDLQSTPYFKKPERWVYLDNQSTTSIAPEVLETMYLGLRSQYGNASSTTHFLGYESKLMIEGARQYISGIIGAYADEIFFTSSATESNNMALIGLVRGLKSDRRKIITTPIEHKSVLAPLEFLSKKGEINLEFVKINSDGSVDLTDLTNKIDAKTLLVSIIHANNEIGIIQPLKEIGIICKEKNVLFHSDATQSLGKILIHVEEMGIDLLTFNAHKIYGPKGVGALYVRKTSPAHHIEPLQWGGPQENQLRPGTQNVASIMAFAKAIELSLKTRAQDVERILKLKQTLLLALTEVFPNLKVNSPIGVFEKNGLPENLHITLPHLSAEDFMKALPSWLISASSACTSGLQNRSHVLKALGLSDSQIQNSLRISLGKYTTNDDIEFAVQKLKSTFTRLIK